MKKKVFSLMMTLLLAFVGVAKAEVVTIGEGTSTYYYYPVNMYFNYSLTEQIYTADEIGTAGTINSISFYYDYTSSFTMNNVSLYMKNVTRDAFASNTDMEPLALEDIVWTGTLSATTAGWVTITLDTPFAYDGTSNLLVAAFDGTSGYPGSSWKFRTTPCTGYKGIAWYSDTYTPDPYNTASGFNGSKLYTQYRANVQLDITTDGGGGFEDKLHVKYMDGENEVIDTLNLGVRPAGYWMEPFQFTMYSEGPTYTVTVLDFTPSDGMFTVEGEELPFQVAPNADVELVMGTNENAPAGLIERQFVAITEGNRAAHIWPVTVELYDPMTPDVWELACEEATEFPFVEVPQTAHNMELHNDYDLPFDEIEEGYDAVYKLEFENDMVLNAEVTQGENGKVALYTEDFYGEGGPMATNNYNGPTAAGGAAAPFEVQIGEGTSTTGYFPFYTLYNYSIAENLFLATELAEAGVTTAPMTSLSWYATNAPGYAQQGITIWMANVEDAALTTTSHIVTNMTKVYTGAMTPAIGWNEFVFNEGTFSWDGQSNVLIFCQRNNGAWNSTVNWQATTSLPFNAMAYRYQDSGAYDPTVANPMYTSTTRPNIILKSEGGREVAEAGEISYGPVITNAPVAAGIYYLVASSTDADLEVTINAEEMPCPEVEGFAFNPVPADDEDELEPASVTLQWMNPANATEYQVVFGSTYYPQPGHPQTVISDWTPVTGATGSFTVRNLWNNTNYFWYVVFRNNGACEEGVETPHWGFTTHLNIPQNLTAVDETVFNDEQIVLNWNAVVDRTYRMYNVYRDGELIGHTTVNNIGNTTYTDGPLAYNMDGYTYYVTAVYDEGESAPSNTVNVKVSGYGDINGHVYEQDGTTGIAGATVTMVGQDEFGVSHTYNFTTNNQGYYTGHIYAGAAYDGQAAKDGYQTATAPVQGEPIVINYNQTTTPIDYILDENFDAPCTVIAEYYPDSLDPNSPYVKVYWGCGLPGEEIIEPFETGDFSLFDWQVDPTYPWSITTNQPYEGTYCMQSGGAGVANVVSNMTVTVDIPADGIMSFFGKISCENNWDYGYFYIDGVQKGSYTGASSWGEKKFDITAGTHTFQWRYTKDGSVNSNDDRFYVDYITFYKRPEPAQPGWHTYCESEFNNAVGSNVGTSRWAYEYPTSLCAQYAGFTLTKVSLFSDNMYSAVGGNYTCVIYAGGNEPMAGTAVSTITVDVPQNLNAWVDFDLTTPVQVTGNEPLWVVWTANTHLSNWPAGCCDGLVDQGTWWSAGLEAGYGWEHQTYGTWTMRQYFNNREGRGFYSYASENAPVAVNAPVVARGAAHVAVKGETEVTATCANPNAVKGAPIAMNEASRSLSHYRVYRTNCYQECPFTEENTVLLATVWVPDTVYIDVEWYDLPAGVYKWGVGAVYEGNRGELVEGPITWTAPQAINTPVQYTAEDYARMNSLAPQTEQGEVNPMPVVPGMTRGNTAYACNAYGGTNPTGWISYDVDNPGAGTSVNSGVTVFGGDLAADGYVYATYNDNNWYKIDPLTGTVAASGNLGMFFVDCAYDYTTDVMYGSYSGTLYTWDLANNTYATVGAMHGSMQMIAIDLNGQMYGIEYSTGDFYAIDKTSGACTLIGNTGYSPAYVQGGGFDHNTGKLYWAGYTSTGIFCEINPATGAATLLGNNVGEQLSWCVPYTYNPGPTPGPGGDNCNELALPRESETIWSNCLDKDMFIVGDSINNGVTVNVLLNSADSPAGVNVSFTNYNEAEQEMYPIAPIVLDETGFYAYPEFRKGEYQVKVEFEGYEPIEDSVSIWNPTDLRYVMTEIIYGVDNLYVSSTGWAMWDAQGAAPGPQPGPGGDASTFSENFDAGMPAGWTTVDANNDGYDWVLGSQAGGVYLVPGASLEGTGHNSSADMMCSGSYDNNTWNAITPDNYLVSPQVTLANGSTFSFWACAQDAGYPAEHFGVFVSDNGTSDWTEVQSWTMTAKSGGNVMSIGRDGATRAQGNWYQKTVDLSAFAGQKYIAIRHFGCNDQFILDVDDVELTAGRENGDRHLEYFKVMCTSIDGEPIFNADVPAEQPFCQLNVEDLVEGEHYICKVAAVYSTGMSAWSECEWQYIACNNYAGTVNGVEVNGTTISWEYPGVGPGPQPGQGSTFSENFDAGMPAGWTTVDANNDGYDWVLGSQAGGVYLVPGASLEGTGHNSSADMMCSGSYDNNTWNAITPDNYLVSPQVTLVNGSTFSFWACAQDAGYPAEHFGVFISDNGTSDWTEVQSWTMTAKNGGNVMSIGRDGNTRAQGNWYQKTVDLSAFAGQKYIAIRHFGCNDQFLLDVDDVELTAGAKSNRDVVFFNGFVTDPGAMANGADASWIKGTQTTWGPNVNNGGGYMLADQFTLSAATTISEIEVYGYQTGSSTTSTFTGMYAQIFNGSPMSGGTAVWGNMSTNIMTATAFTNCYRGSDGETTAMTRPIMSITAGNLDIQLEAGTYYLVYSLTGTLSSGPWGAPHCEPNIGNTGNGLQYTTGWGTLQDSGDGSSYGCAMKITGAGGPNPQPGEGNVLGAMVFLNGEWEAFVPYPTAEYTYDEAGDYCVRMVYDGTNTLPEGNIYYSMSCPECTEGDDCAPVTNLVGQYMNNEGMEGLYVDWEDPEGATAIRLYADGQLIGELPVGQHPIFLGFDSQVPEHTFVIGAQAIHPDCESEIVEVEVYYDDVIENEANVALFPNPTTDNVTIQAEGMSHITVTSVLGQVVYDADVNGDEMVLNMGQFNAGMYMVRINTANGVVVKRVTVMQ